MINQLSVWRLIPHHAAPDKQRQWSRATGRLAIGWGEIGDLRLDEPRDAGAISQRITAAYPDLTSKSTGGPSLWHFAFEASEGDLVILGKSGASRDVYEIVGPYLWASLADSVGDYQHQRPAVLTTVDADILWRECGGRWVDGHNLRWTFAKCGQLAQSRSDGEVKRPRSEGTRFEVVATVIERDPHLRREAIKIHGYACAGCDVVLSERYAGLCDNFIHIHHLTQLADLEGPTSIDPATDLVPLCPNCHAMVHTSRPPVPINELRAALRAATQQALASDATSRRR